MSTYSEILSKLKGLNSTIVPCFPATVKSIDTESTCTVIMADGLEMPGVRLKASNDDKKEFLVCKPREKSYVLIGLIGDEECAGEYYVAACDEIDEVVMKIKDLELLATKDGVSLIHKDAQIGIVDDSINLVQKDTTIVLDNDKALLSFKNNLVKIVNSEIMIQGAGGVRLNVSANGIALKDVIKGILDCIQNLKVVTPTGIGTPDPTTIASVIQAGVKIEQIFS